jgi:hypothetical protein
MRAVALALLSLPFAACAGAQYAERLPTVPPSVPQASQPARLAPTQQQLVRTGPADSEATRAWLDGEIERNRYVPPPPPPRVERRVVEREVVVRREYVPVRRYYDAWDSCEYDYDRGVYVETRSRRPQPTFPWHTAVGAGLGAVIGHQSGHRSEGAWIGAGYGLLLDIARW